MIGIDNVDGSLSLESYDLPRDCVLLLGQEGEGLTEVVLLTSVGAVLLFAGIAGVTLALLAVAVDLLVRRVRPSWFAVLMGVVTAVFGGVLRDIVCNDIPSAFSDHQPYAICAFAGGWVLVGAQATGAPSWLALLAAAGTATGLRAAALATGYTLPQWRSDRH